MGFVGNFLSTLFSPRIPSAQSQQPTVTGRDLVESTESAEPNAPQMGTDNKNKRNRGASSLLVSSENLYKGSV